MSAERSYKSIDEVRSAFSAHGITLIYVKKLAPNQDNEKNQIYLGRGLNAVTSIIPAAYSVRHASKSTKKRKSDTSQDLIEGRIKFSWMDRQGKLHKAPETKLIDYFQYPEVRLSGFLKKCSWAPNAIRRNKQDNYGQRILLFGVTSGDQAIGLLLTALEDPVVANWPELPAFAATPLLATLAAKATPLLKSAVELLCDELRVIVDHGWHEGQRLKPDGVIVPFTANQAGGYTLEALLEVRSNSAKTPDKYGHEIKAYSSNRISLMTPTPDGGEQGRMPFVEFIQTYGWSSKTKGASLKVFNGTHVFGKVCPSTQATLVIDGYDLVEHKITDTKVFKVALRRNEAGATIDLASWSLAKLATSWSDKHAAAAYLPFVSESSEKGAAVKFKRVKYGPSLWLASGTDITLLIKAIALGFVFYDPADEVPVAGKPNNRPQWRILSRDMAKVLAALYRNSSQVTL